MNPLTDENKHELKKKNKGLWQIEKALDELERNIDELMA